MAQVVTELVIRGDGALDTLDRFEQGMENAGRATDQTTGAVADFERRMEAARAKIERGNAITTESIERKSAEQRAWDRWSATVDKTTALRIRLERESANAAVAAANAVNLGYTTQEQALSTLMALEARHAAQLSAVATQNQRVTQAAVATAAANDNLARSMTRVAGSAEAGSFQTANIAAQFQDIGVTAAMGMNPIMIALQQGTQLSAVLNTMQNPLRGLASAFISIINPVSLLTIGFVALAAAGAQWIMQAFEGAEDAEDALRRHSQWLDKILVGYDGAREAAKTAAEEAQKLPQAVVASDLQADIATQQAARAEILERIARAQAELNSEIDNYRLAAGAVQGLVPVDQDYFKTLTELNEQFLALDITSASTAAQLESFHKTVADIGNTSVDAHIRGIATSFREMIEAAQDANSRAMQSGASLAFTAMEMQSMADIRAGIDDLNRKHFELEAAARRAAAALKASMEAALQAAQGYGQAAGAANVYAGSLQRLQALIPAVAAAQQAQNDLAAATIEYDKGIKALEAQRENGLSRDSYISRERELTDAYTAARGELTGLTAAIKARDDAERQAQIGAMAPQKAAAERIRDQYAAIEAQLKAASAAPEELARNTAAMNLALETSAASFAKTGGAAGGAAKALKAAERDFNSFISTADKLAEALFPGEYARREAMELQAALDMYGASLDDFQRKAVQAEIGDLFTAAERGVRRLEDTTKDAARNMGKELQNTLGSILGDLFSKPIEDFDDFIDRVMSGLGQLGQANLSASMDMLFGGGDGLSKAVERGAKAGTEAGQADFWSSLTGGASGAGGDNPLMQALGAGTGGLGIGYQTQSPVMGALGGAMQGLPALMMGNPLPAIIGGIGGFLGGLFGMNKALQEAQEKLAKVRGEIDTLIDVGEGRGVGQMTQAFRDYWDKSHEYQELAMKAGDGALQKRLQEATNTFFLQLDKDFRLGFEGTLDALSNGQGMNGPFVSAQQQIVSLREELKGFIADTEYMAKKLGELAGIDNAAEVVASLERARRAAQDHALSVLAGAETLTDMEKAALEAEGKASALQVTLEQLGMSAEEAASAITGALGMAMAKLRDEYARDINSSINDLSGFGFINEIVEAQAKYQERLRDASALGLDGASAMQELNLSLTGIARSAGLTQSQIDMLAQTFPAMAGMLADLADNDAGRKVADAQSALRAAYEAAARALETTINRLDRFITSVQKFRDNLRLDDNLSPLNPQERLIEAQRQFQTVMAQAMGGDEDAMGRVEEVSRNYLEEARAYHGTSVQYFAIFEEVESLLDGVLASAKNQLSDAQRELALLQQQVGALIDINTSVLSVADAIANLAAAQAASDAMLAAQLGQLAMANSNAISEVYKSVLGRDADAGGLAYWNNQMNQGKSLGQVTDQITSSREAQVRGLYDTILGRAADASGLQYWVGSNKAISQIEEEMRYLRSIGSYASGGFTGYGGVNDPAGIVHRGEYVIPAADVSRIGLQNIEAFRTGRASNDNGMAALVQEFRDLRQQVARLESGIDRNTQVTAAGAQAQVNATGQTTNEVAKQSNAAWKVAHTRKTG